MNKIIVSFALVCIVGIKAQVAIGKASVTNPSVSLEFANTENRGLVLPYVESNSGISENGTLIYNTADKKVKYLKGGSWFDLSVDTTGNADLSIQTTKAEKTGAKVSIGTPTSTDGILVLEDNNKAMILPKVASPHLNVINPAAGMMVYDTTARQLAVYNGTVWSFWKP
ncbi:hypothetical protein HHL23_04935 [Chryseobacterium sp. RP-3-3]|uniref:Uncharacterized protein n=1 Tax=Chryseobacterium antibioticum TaxID=2728847 RepID=A0A7Y0FQX2_9FLAO|nr:hypothetical protein [Chryseobacterium antibioticum]NML69135.1 hypothetical protein [Chryseobacterium antibioticum]